MPSPIQDYAIIGDERTCALISTSGSIDFLWWPRFDSDACFAALLGNERHGHWLISPSDYVRDTARRYLTDTSILETDHRTDTGQVRVTEFMSWDEGPSSIIQAMAWAGISRFVRAHANDDQIDPALIGRLRELSDVIHRTVCERGFSTDLGHFVQHYGAATLDASLLLLPLVGFLPIDDPRVAGTIAAVERDLMDGGLVRRRPQAPEGQDEGVFLACSCWLADCYKMQGRDDEAAALLDRVIGVANDVGLLSEEYDVRNRSLIGNIPQALTHLGLVNTALFHSGPVIQRAGG